MDFSAADNLDTARFNRVLWQGLKGDSVPYPSRNGADLRQNRKSLLEEFKNRSGSTTTSAADYSGFIVTVSTNRGRAGF